MPISTGFVMRMLLSEKRTAAKSWRKLDKATYFLFTPHKFREEDKSSSIRPGQFRNLEPIREGNIRQREAPPDVVLLWALRFAASNTTFGQISPET
jgi:hypothetical protein